MPNPPLEATLRTFFQSVQVSRIIGALQQVSGQLVGVRRLMQASSKLTGHPDPAHPGVYKVLHTINSVGSRHDLEQAECDNT